MTEHRLLTGDALHEPKGVETATNGQVYVANGSGSGTWQDRLSGILNLNSFNLSGRITDVSETTSFYHVVPTKGNLTKLYAVLDAAITGANSTLTISKNGIDQTPTVTIPYTGSGPGVVTSLLISPNISFNEGDVIRVRSDGGSTGSASLAVEMKFTATA